MADKDESQDISENELEEISLSDDELSNILDSAELSDDIDIGLDDQDDLQMEPSGEMGDESASMDLPVDDLPDLEGSNLNADTDELMSADDIDLAEGELPDVDNLDLDMGEIPDVDDIDFGESELPDVDDVDLDLSSGETTDLESTESKVLDDIPDLDTAIIDDVPDLDDIDLNGANISKTDDIDLSDDDIPTAVDELDLSETPDLSMDDIPEIDLATVDMQSENSDDSVEVSNMEGGDISDLADNLDEIDDLPSLGDDFGKDDDSSSADVFSSLEDDPDKPISSNDGDDIVALSENEMDNILSDVDESQVVELGSDDADVLGDSDNVAFNLDESESVTLSGDELDNISDNIDELDNNSDNGDESESVTLSDDELDNISQDLDIGPELDLTIDDDNLNSEDISPDDISSNENLLSDSEPSGIFVPAEPYFKSTKRDGGEPEGDFVPDEPYFKSSVEEVSEQDTVIQQTEDFEAEILQSANVSMKKVDFEVESPVTAASSSKPKAVADQKEIELVQEGELSDLFKYLDSLLEYLPEEKVKEFAESKFYDKYISIINRLGL